MQRTNPSRWVRPVIGSVVTLIIMWPIFNRIYQLITPPNTRAIYEAGLSDLETGNLGETQVAIELLSAADSKPPYRLVLEGAMDLRLGRLQQAVTRLIPALEDPATSALAHTLTAEAKERLELTLSMEPKR